MGPERADSQHETERLVEPAPDEAVVRALAQSAHPVEFVESNPTNEDDAASDE